MKKVGIMTINDYTNYGNRFQNYAVQEVLKSLNIEPTTIVNTTIIDQNKNKAESSRLKRLVRLFIGGDFNKIQNKIYHKRNEPRIKQLKLEKESKFKKFTFDYINEADKKINYSNIPDDLHSEFDYFVTGSDQVWNPSFRRFSELDFITFAPKDKRIAYSPSFGISQIPKEYESNFKVWIENMNSLSVREEAGAKIIKDLTDREAVVLVDPTMMLDKKDWLSISKEAEYKPKNRYLCTYFLGETYEAHRKEINRIAKDLKLEVVNLGSVYDLKRYSADPSEFLDYIASSEIFLTDSFHGAIFSIIFEKPFIVFDRLGKLPSMNSRIDTLLSKFNFMDRKWEVVEESKDYFGINFSHTRSIFAEEKTKTFKYLKKAFELENED